MKVMQSGRQTARRLIIIGVHVRQPPFYFGRTCTPGHLIVGVFGQFSAYNTPVCPLTGALLWAKAAHIPKARRIPVLKIDVAV